jgi:hypothetical protein
VTTNTFHYVFLTQCGRNHNVFLTAGKSHYIFLTQGGQNPSGFSEAFAAAVA